jgi:2-methylcitrate dehydratase PrpD
LNDGRVISEVQEHNRGSVENPMTAAELRAKFDENAGGLLSTGERDRLAGAIERIEQLDDVSVLADLTVPGVVVDSGRVRV